MGMNSYQMERRAAQSISLAEEDAERSPRSWPPRQAGPRNPSWTGSPT